jgi:transposase InsO family protein
LFWVVLSRLWPGWQAVLVIVQPATVVHWHRQGFRLFWRWKSRKGKTGRPQIEREIRDLIRRMSRENPIWGAPRIQAELKLLGYAVAESTVAKYMVRTRKPSSPTWKTFLKNHLHELAAVDFFTVPTVTFRVLYVFVVLSLDRRRVLHFHVTTSPSAEWTAQQVVEAFPFDTASRFLMRDRDGIYGEYFQRRVKSLGCEEVVSAPRSPWQNPFVERLIGSIRRECLDHVIVFNERHLLRILRSYFEYYHESRTHMGLDDNAPIPREVERPERGAVSAIPQVGGLHHRYTRRAA